MSVIVKGMEMPENCALCDCSFGALCYVSPAEVNGYCPGHSRPEWCPLVELQEKHGRLIDADAFKETLEYYIREAGWDAKTNRVLGWVKDEFIDSEPTIVEAEGDDG